MKSLYTSSSKAITIFNVTDKDRDIQTLKQSSWLVKMKNNMPPNPQSLICRVLKLTLTQVLVLL